MIPLKDAHSQFIDDLKAKDRAQATVLAYGKDIEQLVDFLVSLDKTQVHHATHEDLKAFLKKLEDEGYTKKSISRKINSTKTFFRFLKINEYITDDPATLITHPKFEVPPPRILSETEFRALRDAARGDTRTHAIIELLLQTGIRIGELSEVTLNQLKLDSTGYPQELYIPQSRTTIERSIPLNKAVSDALFDYLQERPKVKGDHLFITRTGRPLLVRNIRSAIDRYFKKADINNARVNDLRHTWIAQHIKRGASLLMISQLAGHKRLATTEKYLKHIDKTEGKEKMVLEEL